MKPFVPSITKLPKRTVLTITSLGNPNDAQEHIGALYGTAYGMKFKVFKPRKKEMKIGSFSAFWPDAHLKPKSRWTGIWNLEVPLFVTKKDLLQKNPKLPVTMATLKAGTYAQILYVGSYSAEGPTITKLHAYIKAEKKKIVGPHEEVYLTKPGPKARTIIRYAVK